jgi:hypothetical protein
LIYAETTAWACCASLPLKAADLIQKVGRCRFLESSALPFESQIVTSVGEIKALIT